MKRPEGEKLVLESSGDPADWMTQEVMTSFFHSLAVSEWLFTISVSQRPLGEERSIDSPLQQLFISSFSGLDFKKGFQKGISKKALKKSSQKELSKRAFKKRCAQRGRYQQVVMRELAELHLVRWNVLYDEASTGRQLPLIAPGPIISCR